MFVIIAVVVTLSTLFFFLKKNKNFSLTGQHVMITGGSSGIGLAFAIEAAEKGASISLIARNKEKLKLAEEEVKSHFVSENQRVCWYSVDVSHDSEELFDIVSKAEDKLGPIFMLVNCAGTSVCYRFEETPASELQRMIDTNFYGSVYLTRVVVTLMKKRREGKIVFVSSIAGLFGLYGYSAYAASKFALVGMAQALSMELKPCGIGVTVSFPPDTDTPGYAEEIKTKLPETHLISEAGGLVSPRDVASQTLVDAMNNRFKSTCGLNGWMISTACSGTMPGSFSEIICQVTTMGIFRLILSFYLRFCDSTIKKYNSADGLNHSTEPVSSEKNKT